MRHFGLDAYALGSHSIRPSKTKRHTKALVVRSRLAGALCRLKISLIGYGTQSGLDSIGEFTKAKKEDLLREAENIEIPISTEARSIIRNVDAEKFVDIHEIDAFCHKIDEAFKGSI